MSKIIFPKIAFLHIPKTAGVSVIDAFVKKFGVESCESFSNEISDDVFKDKNFVSGHVYLGDIECDAFIFTFVRNPLEQIASHLMWIDHYNLPKCESEINGFPENIRRGIRQLAKTDLSNAKSIDKYLQWLPRDSDLRVINLQSELLAFKRNRVVEMGWDELARIAIHNIRRLEFVGISENFSLEMKALFEMLDLGSTPAISHLNSSPSSRKIDLKLPDINRTLSKYVQADLRLYEHVVKTKRDSFGSKWNLIPLVRSFSRKWGG
jgi:hypothetical protein